MTTHQFLMKTAIFRTRDFAAALGMGIDSASRSLRSLEKEKTIDKITRGIWANTQHPHYSPYGLTPYLLGQEQGYVSFLSALHRHGVISQIPQRIQIATTGHGRTFRSKAGVFDFIQIQPALMSDGIGWHPLGDSGYALASMEKALLDCLYISTRRGKRFQYFPELELDKFSKKEFIRLLETTSTLQSIKKRILTNFQLLWNKNMGSS